MMPIIPKRMTGPIGFAMVALLTLGVCSGWGAETTPPARAIRPAAPGGSFTSGSSAEAPFVAIDFSNVDIHVFIKFISELTGKNFVIDNRVRGKVTIISPGKITITEAYKVFESVLEVHGFSTVKAGEIIKVIPAPDARTKNVATLLKTEAASPEDYVVTQLIPLKYADSVEIKRLFTPLISKSSMILAYPPTNTLIVTDVYSNIKRLLRILKVIDITGIGHEISVIPVRFSDAAKLVKLLESVFKPTRPDKKDEPGTFVTFVADVRTNTIVALASEDDNARIKSLVEVLDREVPRGKDKLHVYYLENATADDLAKVLQELPSQPEGAAATKPEMSVVSSQVRITADKATNSLIIFAEKDDYLIIEEVIKKIDIPRSMVYIESLIMEVDFDKDFRLGTEWVAGNEFNDGKGVYAGGFSGGASGGDSGFINLPGVAGVLAPGFSLGIFNDVLRIGDVIFPNLGAVVQAYKKDRSVHILSTPQILTTDNEEARIVVGRNIPYQTTTSTSDNDTFNSFEYRDVGKTLIITPHISKDRMVRLNITLEVSDLESTTDSRPTTLKRTVDTTVIVRDKNTVVIGGLIDDSFTGTQYKTPCLGDIPGMGWFFRSVGKNNIKTNLYVFLTPRVIENPLEAKAIYGTKKKQIDEIKGEQIKLFQTFSKEPFSTPAAPERAD